MRHFFCKLIEFRAQLRDGDYVGHTRAMPNPIIALTDLASAVYKAGERHPTSSLTTTGDALLDGLAQPPLPTIAPEGAIDKAVEVLKNEPELVPLFSMKAATIWVGQGGYGSGTSAEGSREDIRAKWN